MCDYPKQPEDTSDGAKAAVKNEQAPQEFLWEKIDSASKDGTAVLVFPPTWKGVISCARWNEDQYAKRPRPYWQRLDDFGRRSKVGTCPTHWMPIPPGPSEVEGGSNE